MAAADALEPVALVCTAAHRSEKMSPSCSHVLLLFLCSLKFFRAARTCFPEWTCFRGGVAILASPAEAFRSKTSSPATLFPFPFCDCKHKHSNKNTCCHVNNVLRCRQLRTERN